MNVRTLIRWITPPIIVDTYRKYGRGKDRRYIWDGIYGSFGEVPSYGGGWDSDKWVNNQRDLCLSLIENVKRGTPFVPTDMQSFHYLFILLASLIQERTGQVRILDVGGSVGRAYIYLLRNLGKAECVEYHIVERDRICKAGTDLFENDRRIHFHVSLPKELPGLDVVYLSGVLQYIEDYRGFITALTHYGSTYILLTWTPVGDVPTFASAQRNLSGSVIPHWFFNAGEIVGLMADNGYKLIFRGHYEHGYDVDNFPLEYRLQYHSNLLFALARNLHSSGGAVLD